MEMNYLYTGSRIRILSPSGIVQEEFVTAARIRLESWGYEVSLGEHVFDKYGRFAGRDEDRLNDLQLALDDPDIDAILCSRGGYGLSRIIDRIDLSKFMEHPKWVIGFSDITLLHNLFYEHCVPTVHGIMAKHLASLNETDPSVSMWRGILEGRLPQYQIEPAPENRTGNAKGLLMGGNLSMIMAARGTDYDLDYEGGILFVEEIGEQSYHIDRMFQNLRIGGVLEKIAALVVGHITDCEEDGIASIRENILEIMLPYNVPVVFGFPSGHEDLNLPLLLGREVDLKVSSDSVLMTYTGR